MSSHRKHTSPTFVIVSQQEARQYPYPYVHVNDDGSVRELSASERSFLETPFLPGDGGRPAIKSSYDSKNGWGSIRGFCRRDKIPQHVRLPASGISHHVQSDRDSLDELLDQIKALGYQVLENPDGSFTISKSS